MSKCNSSFGISKILSIISESGAKVHFSGVGGASMSSLFCLSHYFGISVSGSDRCESAMLLSLKKRGADIFIGEREMLPEGTALLVYSLAVDDNNKELSYAACEKIPCVSRAEYMAALAECYTHRIAVSGSHGKSTVTAMIYSIFKEEGRAPTALSGAPLGGEEGNFAIGGLETLIYEACEYKDSFLSFSPEMSVFLNMELDHVDYFKNIGQLRSSFEKAAKKCGRAIVNTDDEELRILVSKCSHAITVGSRGGEDYTYTVDSSEPYAISMSISKKGELLCNFILPMLGCFNASNAALAAAVALESDVSIDAVTRALSEFRGIEQRLQLVGELCGAPVFRDYAHHPTEIKAGISAVRSLVSGKIAVIFVPHTYSRTAALFDGFVSALSFADYRIVTEIFAARESATEVSGEMLASAADAKFAQNREMLQRALPRDCTAYMIMGAGECDWVIDCIKNAKDFFTNEKW